MYKVVERRRSDLVIVLLPFKRVIKIDSSSSGGSYYFVSYILALSIVQGYSAERIAPVERQKVDDGPKCQAWILLSRIARFLT